MGVRDRDDVERRLRFITVALMSEQSPWSPAPVRIADGTLVGVRVGVSAVARQWRVKQTGGKWNPVARVWEMPYSRVMALGREDPIEKRHMSNRLYQD